MVMAPAQSMDIDFHEDYYESLFLSLNANINTIYSAFQRESRLCSPISKDAKPLWFDPHPEIRHKVQEN